MPDPKFGRVHPRHPSPASQNTAGDSDGHYFGSLPWEKEAISRAQQKELSGRSVAVASVEDLIVMKLFSEREKDADDARRLLNRFRTDLDQGYLEPLLGSLADSLARPEILEVWRSTRDTPHSGMNS